MTDNSIVDDNYAEGSPRTSKEPERNTKSNILYYIGVGIVTIAVCLLLLIYVGQRIVVKGNSMYPTLSNGDNLYLNKLVYRLHEPERFDVVAIYSPNTTDKKIIKRIIGLPNETIYISENKIYIKKEGESEFHLLNESYGYEPINNEGLASEPIALKDDEYFVLGDNRNNSLDSRYEEVGNIPRTNIYGRTNVRFYPNFSKIQ